MKTFHGETIGILVKTFLTALIGSQNKFNIQTIKISNLWGAFGIGHEEERNALTNVVLYSVDN